LLEPFLPPEREAGLRPERLLVLLLGVLLPDDRDREVEAPPLRVVLLLRDAGGEDVRVAMVVKIRRNPTCPTRHTPERVARPP
jgi:hypothetical protein